ncbi:hypothetical protein R4J09_14225 [Brachyspira intermedia]|uniref:hypothetical protein n=1 Tax=Brachyspira intermedia TaxID=84377 RepID=UPI003003E77E
MENKKIVYFDKNIFSILKNEYKSGNTNNFNKIINSKNKFLYVYSMAHIFDLQNDKTNKKEEDFEFMSQIVDSNYLYYFEQEERFCIDHNIKITDKYKKAENFDDMFKQMDLDYIDSVSNPFIIQHNKYIENKKLYNEYRKNIKFILKNNDDIKQLYMSTIIENFYKNKNFNIFQKYLSMYLFIDIVEDKLSEKNYKLKYRNMFIDGMHSCFSMSSDYFITNDENLSLKSNLCYVKDNGYNIRFFHTSNNTGILDLNKFILLLDNI